MLMSIPVALRVEHLISSAAQFEKTAKTVRMNGSHSMLERATSLRQSAQLLQTKFPFTKTNK